MYSNGMIFLGFSSPFIDEEPVEQFTCAACGNRYKHQRNLLRHRQYECGKQAQFQCPYCVYRSKQKATLKRHIIHIHPLEGSRTWLPADSSQINHLPLIKNVNM